MCDAARLALINSNAFLHVPTVSIDVISQLYYLTARECLFDLSVHQYHHWRKYAHLLLLIDLIFYQLIFNQKT